MTNFFGYGNLDAPFWFVGKEEGGGENLEENIRRVCTWEALRETTTVDLIDYHKRLGFTEHKLTRTQQTWTKLIQILLILENRSQITIESRKIYQRNNLGRLIGTNCLLELMPVASRKTNLWLGKKLFKEYFGYKNKTDYFRHLAPLRRMKIKDLIALHKPRVVIFYSSQKNYIDEWNLISGITEWKWTVVSKSFKYGWAKKDGTLFAITTHPTSHGVKGTDYPAVGEFIKLKLDEN